MRFLHAALPLAALSLSLACPQPPDPDDDDVGPDTAPTVATVVLSPTEVRTDDTVSATATASDPDGDEVTIEYSWSVNGDVVAGAAGPSLDGSVYFEKGDLLSASAVATAGGSTSAATSSEEITVLNTAPTAPGPTMLPTPNPTASVDLVCSLETPSTDADDDALTYDITWADDTGDDRSGEALDGDLSGDTIPLAATAPGEVWTCTVTAHDGDETSAAGTATAAILPLDSDGDGSPRTADCNDFNAVIYPGAPELCDGWDNDCDSRIDEVVAYWPFDGDLLDATGAGSDLTTQGTNSFVQDGICGEALSLNQGEAATGDSGSLSNFYGTSGLTIALWGRPIDCNVGGGDAFCPYVSKGGSGPGMFEEYTMGTTAARDRSYFSFQTGAGASGASVSYVHASMSGWHSFVSTFDPTGGALTLYLDGAQVSQDTLTALPHAGGDVTFGTNPAGGLERGQQDIDDAMILNCPMSNLMVQAHYDCGGCGCVGGRIPCDTGEYWTGTACATQLR